jgi:hypothetical protein
MNLTVGPLPPAVYWRRRALLLGVVLLLVVVLVAMCEGSGGANKSGQGLAGSTQKASPTPSQTSEPPIIGGAGSATGGSGGTAGSTAPSDPSAAAGATPAAGGSVDPAVCTDAEMQLTPAIQEITGGNYPYELSLKIKNISTRSCKRDVGAGPQEMHITDAAGHVLWSSDYCQSGGGSDVRMFGANIESSFQLPWDGDGDGPGCAKGARLGPGGYQLVAKLGTKVSAAVGFTIKAGAPVGS